MKAKQTIMAIAQEKGINAEQMAKAMRYTHVNSFYRALNAPDTINLIRLKKLARSLGMTICELTEILK